MEAHLTYLGLMINDAKMMRRIREQVLQLSPNSPDLASLDTLHKAFIWYYGHDSLFLIHFTPIFDQYALLKGLAPDSEEWIDVEQFFQCYTNSRDALVTKKLLRAFLL